MVNFKLGSDPEIPLLDSQGEPISAENLVGGTKEEPMPIGNENFIQEDGAMLEYNTRPAVSLEDWLLTHNQVFDYIREKVLDVHNVNLCEDCECTYDKKYLTPQVKELGCEPDECIYLGYECDVKIKDGYRCASGHLHISYEGFEPGHLLTLLPTLDVYLSLPALAFEKVNKRREYYGKAGTFRFDMEAPFKFEYRTPSNWWIFNDETRTWVYNKVQFILNNREQLVIDKEDYEAIQEAINCNNLEAQEYLSNKYLADE